MGGSGAAAPINMPRIVYATFVVAMVLGFPAQAQVSCTVHYSCTSAQCAKVIGGWNVTKGPFNFSSESECLSQARQQMTSAKCSCRASGAAGSASGAAPSSGSLYTGDPSRTAANVAQNVLRNVNPQTNQQWGMAIGGAVGAGLIAGMFESAMQGPTPQQLAAREAARQEQARLAHEAAERKRLEDEARHRSLVAGLRGTEDGAGQLSLRREGSAAPTASNLDLLKRDGVPLTPFPQGVPPSQAALVPLPGDNLSLLRRGDAGGGTALQQLQAAAEQGQLAAAAPTPEEASNRASQVFDTPLQQRPVVDPRDPQPIRADNATPITGAGLQQGAPDKASSVNPTAPPPTAARTVVAAAPSGPKPTAKPLALPATTPEANSTPVARVAPQPSPAPRPGYIYSGNGLIGGTSWIAGYNVPPGAAEEIQRKAIEMFRKQAELAGIPYNAAVDFDRYDFVLGVAASTSIIKDLSTRVLFDELQEGRFTPTLQNAYNSLKGRQFDQLECHSNGAMVCLAALNNKDVVARDVVLYGPQITQDSLRIWQGLVYSGQVSSVRVMINQGDPVPGVAILFGGDPLDGGRVLYDVQNVRSIVNQHSPALTVTVFSCSGRPIDLACHDMRVYKSNRGCRPSSGATVPGTAIPGATGLLEPPPPC